MIAQPQPLIEVFAEIPDFRCCRGKRHPLPAMLSLACCAMLCGSRSYSAIAEWGRNYGARIAQALGFTHNTPCAATLHTVFRHVDRDAVEAKLGAWAEGIVVSTLAAPSAGEARRGADGKTLRGSRKQGAPGVHLLSALSHHLGLTLAQQAVDDKTNEITQVETVLRQLVLPGPGVHDGCPADPTAGRPNHCGRRGRLRHDRQRESAAAPHRYRVGLYAPASGDRQGPPARWISAMGASSSAISPPVRPW